MPIRTYIEQKCRERDLSEFKGLIFQEKLLWDFVYNEMITISAKSQDAFDLLERLKSELNFTRDRMKAGNSIGKTPKHER